MNIERPLKGTRGSSNKLISKKYQNSHNNKCSSMSGWRANKRGLRSNFSRSRIMKWANFRGRGR